MWYYLPGILLVQVVTVVLFWANQHGTLENLLLRAGLPALFIALITALWLASIGRSAAERRQAKLIHKHSEERERLNLEIERTRSEVQQKANADRAQLLEQANSEKERLVSQAHRELVRLERRVSRRANLKVGLAFMAVTGAGVLMLITELLTLGLLTITTAGGAMGGYLFRIRQTRQLIELAAQPGKEALNGVEVAKQLIPVTESHPSVGGKVVPQPGVDNGNVDSSAEVSSHALSKQERHLATTSN